MFTELRKAMLNCFPLNWRSQKRLPLQSDQFCHVADVVFSTGAGKRRRGAAAAEFAIVAPVFFLMVIGFIEFGRALMVQQVLINASRVGAQASDDAGATTPKFRRQCKLTRAALR